MIVTKKCMTGVISEAGHFLNYLACMYCVGQKVHSGLPIKLYRKTQTFSPTQYHHGRKKKRRRNMKGEKIINKICNGK